MIVGNHPHVLEYDGAFKCYACEQSWGAVPGNPPMSEKCEREERRKEERRAKEQPTRCSLSFEHQPHDYCDGNPGAKGLPSAPAKEQAGEQNVPPRAGKPPPPEHP